MHSFLQNQPNREEQQHETTNETAAQQPKILFRKSVVPHLFNHDQKIQNGGSVPEQEAKAVVLYSLLALLSVFDSFNQSYTVTPGDVFYVRMSCSMTHLISNNSNYPWC